MLRRKSRRHRGRALRWFVLAVLLLLMLAMGLMLLAPYLERGDRSAVEGSADWMARLDDGLPLNRITLPGTHDSATQFVQLAFFSRCQGLSVKEQLEAGFRYLDIRLGVEEETGALKLMHGFTDCKTGASRESGALYLEEVLRACYAFLSEHPGETVIFAVKQEYGDTPVAEFETMLDELVQRDAEFWLLTDGIPSLGEARGKLLLMRRYADEAGLGSRAGLPLLWKDQPGSENPGLNTVPENNGSYTLWVQDRYEYGAADKWTAFRAGLDNDATVRDVSLNFLSTKGSWRYGHPWYFARALNTHLMSMKFGADRFYGWIVMDFGGAPLAEHIYSANFG